jgi:hypothetical protein
MLLRILLLFSFSLLYSINPPNDMDFPIGFWDEMRLQDIGQFSGMPPTTLVSLCL